VSNILSTEAMRAMILKTVDELGGHGATFVTLMRAIPEFSGGRLKMTHPKFSSWVLWEDLTQEAATALERLFGERTLVMLPTNAEAYVFDGGALNLPLVRAARQYPQDHWQPVVIGRPEVYERLGMIKRKNQEKQLQ